MALSLGGFYHIADSDARVYGGLDNFDKSILYFNFAFLRLWFQETQVFRDFDREGEPVGGHEYDVGGDDDGHSGHDGNGGHDGHDDGDYDAVGDHDDSECHHLMTMPMVTLMIMTMMTWPRSAAFLSFAYLFGSRSSPTCHHHHHHHN